MTTANDCTPCKEIDAGKSALCVTHRRAYLGADAPPDIARLIDAGAHLHGITLEGPGTGEPTIAELEAEARAELETIRAQFVDVQNSLCVELPKLRQGLAGHGDAKWGAELLTTAKRIEGLVDELISIAAFFFAGIGDAPPAPAPAALEPPPPPTEVAINVEAIEMNGARVVRLVIPAGEKSVAVALPSDTAIALARVLVEEARKAKNPAGLILLPGS